MPSPTQFLWETEDTGPLTTAGYRASEVEDASRPSLSGSYTGPGAVFATGSREPIGAVPDRGLGGSVISKTKASQRAYRPMSPDELMAEADRHILSLQGQTAQASQPHMSAVEPTLQRPPPMAGGDIPDWLRTYMDVQVPMNGLDQDKMLGYQSERERIRALKSLKN